MTIVIDQANIGNAAIDASAGTIPFTTSAVVASAGFIVLEVTWNTAAVTLSSVAGGSLGWTIDKQGASANGSNASCALVSAQAAAGLASGTTITATFSGSTVGRGIGGTSFTGVATSSPVDTTSGPTDYNTSGAWTSASTTIAAGSVLIACAKGATTNDTSTITGPSIEAQDFNAGAGTFCVTAGYRIEAAGGGFTVAGTWTGSEIGTVVAVAYKTAAAAAAQNVLHSTVPFMSNGRI